MASQSLPNPQSIEYLLEHYPERVPATLETRSQLPLDLRAFYRGRNPSELALRCMIAKCLNSVTFKGGSQFSKKCASPVPRDIKHYGLGGRYMIL
jgi:hypothetical protein